MSAKNFMDAWSDLMQQLTISHLPLPKRVELDRHGFALMLESLHVSMRVQSTIAPAGAEAHEIIVRFVGGCEVTFFWRA